MQGMTGDGSLSERLSSARLGLASEQNENATTSNLGNYSVLAIAHFCNSPRDRLCHDCRSHIGQRYVSQRQRHASRAQDRRQQIKLIPSIGPAISLTWRHGSKFGVEAVIFDNGKKKAERAMARRLKLPRSHWCGRK